MLVMLSSMAGPAARAEPPAGSGATVIPATARAPAAPAAPTAPGITKVPVAPVSPAANAALAAPEAPPVPAATKASVVPGNTKYEVTLDDKTTWQTFGADARFVIKGLDGQSILPYVSTCFRWKVGPGVFDCSMRPTRL